LRALTVRDASFDWRSDAAERAKHVDNTLVHQSCRGRLHEPERFRTVLDGESHGIFQGKIVVEPHAQKTDAKWQAMRFCSPTRRKPTTKPGIRDFCRHVQCGHGATAGALDQCAQVLPDVARHTGK
jgi:Fe-S cluster assembly protein SufD